MGMLGLVDPEMMGKVFYEVFSGVKIPESGSLF